MDHQTDILGPGVLGKGGRGAPRLLPEPTGAVTDPETLLWKMSPKSTANDVHE